MVLALIALGLVALGFLAMRRSPLWQWALAAVVLAILSRVSVENGLWLHADLLGWIVALLPAVILGLFAIPAIRRAVLIGPAYGFVKSILPRVSRTEQEALDAGTIGWDAELFSGRPDWKKLLTIRKATLSDEEQAFVDGPVEEDRKSVV